MCKIFQHGWQCQHNQYGVFFSWQNDGQGGDGDVLEKRKGSWVEKASGFLRWMVQVSRLLVHSRVGRARLPLQESLGDPGPSWCKLLCRSCNPPSTRCGFEGASAGLEKVSPCRLVKHIGTYCPSGLLQHVRHQLIRARTARRDTAPLSCLRASPSRHKAGLWGCEFGK